VNLLAAKVGPGTEAETGLDNKSAVAFEKHRIRLRMAAGAWRDYHEPILMRLPFFVHSCTADAAVQEDLRRADERQQRGAQPRAVQSFASGASNVGGASPCLHAAPGSWLGEALSPSPNPAPAPPR
jgi:hypothetical protein